MKLLPLILLTCLALPLGVEAKPKKKRPPTHAKPAATPPRSSPAAIDPPGADHSEEPVISTTLSGKEIEFFQTAFDLGGTESYLGEQAKKRGEADRVKAVGDALQAAQAEENERLLAVAKRKGVALPEKAKSASRRNLEKQLAKLSGPAFDKAILEQISSVTQQALDAYQSAIESPDAEVKKLATEILPLIRDKLILANQLAGKPLPPGAKPGFRESVPPAPPAR